MTQERIRRSTDVTTSRGRQTRGQPSADANLKTIEDILKPDHTSPDGVTCVKALSADPHDADGGQHAGGHSP
jgi:hypothetical protein